MLLTDNEKKQITQILKRRNRFHWNDNIILKVIEILNQLRENRLNKTDFFVFGILTYEDYLYNLNLTQFL